MNELRGVQCLVLLLCIFAGLDASGWHYEHEDTWPQLCKEGKKQSPIAVEKKRALKKEYPPLIFTNYHKVFNSTLKNNGHSAEVRLKTNLNLTVQGGGLSETYFLDHLHFHWASEHIVDNYRYPLELHLVHYASSRGNLSNAMMHDKGIAVFSVMYDLSPDDDVEFTSLISILERLKEKPDTGEDLKDFYVHDYLPRDTAGFYRYSGSLTTPTCNEGVIWTIFTNTIPISESQVKIFHSLKTDEYKELTKNYRTLQKLNGRNVYLKVSPIHKSSRANSLTGRTTGVQLFITLIICISSSLLTAIH